MENLLMSLIINLLYTMMCGWHNYRMQHHFTLKVILPYTWLQLTWCHYRRVIGIS